MSTDLAPSKLPILPQLVQTGTNCVKESSPQPDPQGLANAIPCSVSPVHVQPPRLLSPRQLNAIPLLLAGQSDEDVAQAIGAARQSVWRWRHQHPRFIAELNRQRALRHADTLDRLDRALNTALQQIEEYQHSYTASDNLADLGLRLLRFTGKRLLNAPPTTPTTNPHEIELQLLSEGADLSPDDSPADDAPPPPPKKPRK